MLTAAFAELDRLCPQGTRADIYESSRTFFYGTWTAAGRPEKAFKYVAEPVCPEALRALWCCWHLGTRVLINYGLTRYAAEHQHQANSAEYFGQPWITANVKGGLFSDMQDDPGEEPADPRHSFMSDGLWIGTVSRRELVLLKNILAIRWLLDDEPTALYVADEYKPPEFVLEDGLPNLYVLRHEGAFVAKGRSFKFAENWQRRFGATLINRTQKYQDQLPKLVQIDRRSLQIGRRYGRETNDSDRASG